MTVRVETATATGDSNITVLCEFEGVTQDSDSKFFAYFRRDKREFVRCDACFKNQEIVKFHAYNRVVPAIATENGTRSRSEIVLSHTLNQYHKECVKTERKKLLELPKDNQTSIETSMSNSNSKLADHVGTLMIQIYNDAKRLSLSAYSWPSRYVSGQASNEFSFNANTSKTIPSNIPMQYVNRPGHLQLMTCIVEAERDVIKDKISTSLAISLRADGSIDRTQKDKIYVMAKIIGSDGIPELLFLGVAEQTQRGANGLLQAVLTAVKQNFGDQFLNEQVLQKISSICTDGTNVNTGDKGGLWKYLEDEIFKSGSNIQLIKIWCAAHRSELAFEDVEKQHPQISKVFSILSSISSFYHTSAIRSTELQQIAQSRKLENLAKPKIFKIRWVEYTYRLLRAILESWNAIVLHLEGIVAEDKKVPGFLSYLKSLEKLKLVSFLADLLLIFKRLQKKLQSNSLTLLSMNTFVKSSITSLENLKSNFIPGAYEATLNESVATTDEGATLKGVLLNGEESTTATRGNRSRLNLETFREDVCESLIKFLKKRMDAGNSDLVKEIEPFVKLDPSTNITKVHEMVGRDLSLTSVYLQFSELAEEENVKELSLQDKLKFLSTPDRIKHFREILIMFARIAAATPHSADVERCISANNLLKTNLRSNLLTGTENKYLFIYFNLPALESWDPRRAVSHWILSKQRRVHTDTTTNKKTLTEQSYFKGVFENAVESDEDQDEDEEET